MAKPPENFDKLCFIMRLTPYQRRVLESNYSKYDMSGLVKRDGVLYAPYAGRGIWARTRRVFVGRRADLIGANNVLAQNQYGIKF